MRGSVVIRPAVTDDVPQMCDLLSELFSIESDFSPDRQKQARGLNLLLNDLSNTSIVLVAEEEGEILGMCSAQTLISTVEGGPVGLLEDVIVRKERRGQGIGGRLLLEVFEWCSGRNITRIQLLRDADNTEALKFYRAGGWSDTRLLCMRRHL
jgi:ribosomal protein S18 acetylase RimI-like enzyme